MTPEQLAKSGTEHAQQRALFAWANMAERYGIAIADDNNSYTVKHFAHNEFENNKRFDNYWKLKQFHSIPQLKWLHAIHNQGHGDAIRGAKAKAEGVKPGILDVHLPVPSNFDVWHSCYIEMKVGKNKPTAEQLEFIAYCNRYNIKTYVCYTWQEARDAIVEYLGLK